MLRRTPVGFIVGDLLWLAGRDLAALPYRRRRELLEELGLARPPVVVSPTFPVAEAEAVMRTAEEYGAEALHARHLDAPYRPGRRPRAWVRVPLRRSGLVVVGGWTPPDPQRPRPGRRAAARCARPRTPAAGCATWAGSGSARGRSSGRSRAQLARLRRAGLPVRRAAAAGRRPATRSGSHPGLVGRVEFTDWTADGRLRLPAWRGLAVDVPLDAGPDAEPLLRPPRRRARGAGRGGPGRAAPGAADAAGATSRCRARAKRATRSGGPRAASSGRAGRTGARVRCCAGFRRTEARRLEQHFVYNALNTIAALMRTDPARARELLLGFADLNRAADRPDGTPGTLADELDRGAGVPADRAGPVRAAAAGGDRRRRGVARPADGAAPGARRGARGGAAAHRAPPGGGTVIVTAERAGAGCLVRVAERDVEGRGGEPLLVAPA